MSMRIVHGISSCFIFHIQSISKFSLSPLKIYLEFFHLCIQLHFHAHIQALQINSLSFSSGPLLTHPPDCSHSDCTILWLRNFWRPWTARGIQAKPSSWLYRTTHCPGSFHIVLPLVQAHGHSFISSKVTSPFLPRGLPTCCCSLFKNDSLSLDLSWVLDLPWPSLSKYPFRILF